MYIWKQRATADCKEIYRSNSNKEEEKVPGTQKAYVQLTVAAMSSSVAKLSSARASEELFAMSLHIPLLSSTLKQCSRLICFMQLGTNNSSNAADFMLAFFCNSERPNQVNSLGEVSGRTILPNYTIREVYKREINKTDYHSHDVKHQRHSLISTKISTYICRKPLYRWTIHESDWAIGSGSRLKT